MLDSRFCLLMHIFPVTVKLFGTAKSRPSRVMSEPHGLDDGSTSSEIPETGNKEANTKLVTEDVPSKNESIEPVPDESEVYTDPEVIDQLTTGTLGLFLPNLQKAKGTLNEVLHNQEVLIETIQQENAKFTDSSELAMLKNTMDQAKFYHTKLINLKKEMGFLLDKSTKLKRRAVKLQQQKQKEELTRAAQLERELERERMLKPKVVRQEPTKHQPPS